MILIADGLKANACVCWLFIGGRGEHKAKFLHLPLMCDNGHYYLAETPTWPGWNSARAERSMWVNVGDCNKINGTWRFQEWFLMQFISDVWVSKTFVSTLYACWLQACTLISEPLLLCRGFLHRPLSFFRVLFFIFVFHDVCFFKLNHGPSTRISVCSGLSYSASSDTCI